MSIWTLDLDGHVLASRVYPEALGFFEGLAIAADGTITGAVGLPELLSFDANLNRLPQFDQPFEMGIGLMKLMGVAWDGNHDRFLFGRLTDVENIGKVYAVPPNLKSKTRLFDLADSGPPPGHTNRIPYMPDEHLIALTHRRYIPSGIPPSIQFFTELGARVESIDLSGLNLVTNPTRIRYILSPLHGKKFAMRFSGETPAHVFHILNRDGTLDHVVDLSATGMPGISALPYFAPSDPSGGRFLFASAPQPDSHRAIITDYSGNEIGEFDYWTALHVLCPLDVEAITSGPNAGDFCMIDQTGVEPVVFKLK
jgi:hypothetical protein